MATNALQLRRLIDRTEALSCSARFEGIVLWISPAQDRLILQDDSGGVMVNMDLSAQPLIKPGQRVLLEGSCIAGRGGMFPQVLVDHDGRHPASEKTGTVFLAPGLLPIRLEWFNGTSEFALGLEWTGPQIHRQPVPSAALFRMEIDPVTKAGRLAQGLNYRCYEGDWDRLPDFSLLTAVRTGTVTNFDVGPRTRDTNVALVFGGCLEVPREGVYQFWLKSDDGAKLYIDNPPFRLTVLGTSAMPSPHLISPNRAIREDQECQWAEAEGTVTLFSQLPESVFLELTSRKGHLYLKFMQDAGSLDLLLHSRIKAAGICQTAHLFDGKAVPSLLVPDLKHVSIIEMAPEHWVNYPILPISSVLTTNFRSAPIVHVSGTVYSSSEKAWTIEDEGGRILIEGAQAPPAIGDHVEVLGRRASGATNVVLEESFYRKIIPKVDADADLLPLLTTVEQVKNLSGVEAQRGYPVKIRGVITSRLGDGYTIQDSTWSVFIRWKDLSNQQSFRIGEYCEIEGLTYLGFAPNVYILRTHCFGPGILPAPLHPTWNELLNGSLDTQFVELQGIVTDAQTNGITLLTRDGRLEIQFYELNPKVLLKDLDDALIRVRGVTSPVFNDAGQMSLARLPFYSPSVIVEEPAPVDAFAIPLKRVSDLFLFDPHADALRRVRIAGQLVGEYEGEYFLMDGNNGLRFRLKTPQILRVGEIVEVVGFPNMAGPSPVLREALARRTGKDFLPAPKLLTDNIPLNGKYDGTLVRVVAHLVRMNEDQSEKVLELQSGTRGFVARLKNDYGLLAEVAPGSLLELTGIYAGQGGDRAANRDIDSFEIFLNSPLDVTVLERPSWWTIQHTLTVMGAMVLVILISLIWITSLHRKVEQRSRQLTAEIQCREQSEKRRVLEEERARIAQDLHDDLGAGLTQIRFLSAVESRDSLVPEETRSQLRQVSEKSNQMVTSLDEIVWAVNPANDSLPSLAAYLCHVSEEFFRLTPVRCRLDVDDMLPHVPLTSEVRHNLFLAVRESLNNIVKHANATEAWLRIRSSDGTLNIVVEDNGRGFDSAGSSPSGNGLLNMRRRLEKIGGRFDCASSSGGTVCRICLNLSELKYAD